MESQNSQHKFIQRRESLIAKWPILASMLILGLVAMTVWIFFQSRWLVDPWFVMQQIAADTISLSLLQTMAMLLPVVFLLCLFLVLVIILFAWAAFANEKRLIKALYQLGYAQRTRSDDKPK